MKTCLVILFVFTLTFSGNAQVASPGKAKLMVVLDESVDGAPVKRKLISTLIEKGLIEAGYQIVDESQMQKIREEDVQSAKNNPARAAELGRRTGADIVISGITELNLMDEKEVYGVKNYYYECAADIKAVNSGTGDVLYSSNSTSTRAAQGKMKAVQDAGKFAADKLIGEMKEAFSKRIATQGSLAGSTIQLRISGADQKHLSGFEKSLAGSKKSKSLDLRYMDGPAAVYDLNYDGGIAGFRSDFPSLVTGFKITGMGASRLDIQFGQFGAAKGDEALAMLDEPPVDIIGFDFPDIFPANISYYAKNPLGTLTLRNNLEQDLKNVKVRISIPDFMTLPSEQLITELKAGGTDNLPVTLVFNASKLQDNDKETFAQARIEIIYFLRGKELIRELIRPVSIHDRNALSWNDPRAIGAFITPTNRAVADATRHFVNSIGRTEHAELPAAVKNAISVWTGLTAMKINYVQDPRSSVSAQVLDYIQYPNEMLVSRSGDCDDSSVLLASCLENINIPTALVLTSDHIFIMLNTGVPEKNWEEVSPVKENLVFSDGMVWIPLETTLLHLPFKTAWEMGAREFYSSKASDRNFKVLPTVETWSVYSPSSLETGKITGLPSNETVSTGFAKEVALLLNKVQPSEPQTPESTIRMAKLLAGQADYQGAEKALSVLDSSQANYRNAMGNISLLAGNSTAAINWFEKAMQSDPKDGGIDFNIGFVWFFSGDTAKAVDWFASGLEKLGGEEKAAEVLGINLNDLGISTRGADKSGKQVSSSEIKGLMQKAMANRKRPGHTVAAEKPAAKEGKNILAYGGRLSADPTQARSLTGLLYWKY
ncbi:MAG: CsgG/HfaB family protein [Bacteroidetes bacterium]|nr:CsgG/HfaB family protein [Bacteroidota bacterium]